MSRTVTGVVCALIASAITAGADVSPTAFWQSQLKPTVKAAIDITAPRYNRVRNADAEKIRQATIRAADRHGIPREFHLALTKRESGFRFVRGPATRYGQAYGPHQILCSTARELGENDCSRLMRDADRSADLSAKYIRMGYDATGSWHGAAAFYHGGPDRRIHGPKTAAYARAVGGSVLARYAVVRDVNAPIRRDLTFGAGIVPTSAFSALSHDRW
jgi:hypothetical protein